MGSRSVCAGSAELLKFVDIVTPNVLEAGVYQLI